MESADLHTGLLEEWDLLITFLPANWRELAAETGALKGLRKDKSVEKLLRVLLLHLGCGYSLQETAVRARQAQLAELTAAAVWQRLRKARDWLRALCRELFREAGVDVASDRSFQVRALDATTVKEPGRTGSLWRLHYSVRLPSLACDFFRLTATKGVGMGESFRQFPVQEGDYLLAGRGYSTAKGLLHVECAGGRATVRVNASSLPMRTPENEPFDLLAKVKGLRHAGMIGSWPVQVVAKAGGAVTGRAGAVHKTQEAIRIAHKALRRQASKRGTQLHPQTLEFAKYVILFTTFPTQAFPAASVLEWYRSRWQVQPVFQRFKSLAQLGHLPKRDDESARAWLYGKLLVALLVEKLIRHASAISPWGYPLESAPAAQRLA
ncbi:MAG: IS4 family transposase [Bryobacterales bacterium]|nr:IS4 family transposase [Bryobacterales bacterium]